MMRSVIPLAARGLRTSTGMDACARRMHSTAWVSKSVTEKISEVADKVNKKVGQGLATAIETGEKATEKTKKTLGATRKHAKEKAEETKQGADQVGQKVKEAGNEVVAGAKQKGKTLQKDL